MGYKLRTSAFTDCGVATTRIRPSEARHVSHLIRAAPDDYKTRAYRNHSLSNRSGLFGNLIDVAGVPSGSPSTMDKQALRVLHVS